MPIRKIGGIEHTDTKTSSEQTDVKESTAHGTESISKKPSVHHKLTGPLFSLKEQSVEAEENSGDGSDIRKIQEAQSENPQKPVQEIGKIKETEPTSMQVTGEPPTTPQNTFTNEGENKTEGRSAELPIHKIVDTESRDSDGAIHKIDIVHKDLSDDEFNSDLVIDEGECDTQTKCAKEKKVAFKLEMDETESVQSSQDTILDSSQETVQTTITQMATDDTELTVTFTNDTQDHQDYLGLSQNVHRPQYVKTDDSSDSEQKWSELEPGDKLQR